VWITGTIGMRMVNAMRHDPLNWPTLECERAAGYEKIFNWFRDFITAMRKQPVKAHADAETSADPIKHERGEHGRPAPEKESRYSRYMRNDKENCIRPIEAEALPGRPSFDNLF
jgi:hypothetical protein